MTSRKRLQFKALVNLKYIHTRINKQLVKEEWIKTELMDKLFKVFNTNGTKNREVTRFIPLELKINRHMEKINIMVIDLNSIDIFLEYSWLVKHNLEVSWNKGTIQSIRYPREYRIKHQDILFTSKTRRLQPTKYTDKIYQKIGKKLDLTSLEGLSECIQLFTYLFNRKKFEKLLE